MKKIKLMLAVLFSILIMPCFLTGCLESENPLPLLKYTDVETAEQYYYVGDEIVLNGQCVDYYKDIRDAKETEKGIPVTIDMISGFSTQEVGEFKYTISYKDASCEYEYYVYEKPDMSTIGGSYFISVFGANTVVEIKNSQVLVKTYEETINKLTKDSVALSTETLDTTVRANRDGVPSLCFVYKQMNYEFVNFENGAPKYLKSYEIGGSRYSAQLTNCTAYNYNQTNE